MLKQPAIPIKIGIIGAGASGLVSAKIMREHGFDVTVYEKKMSIGGVWDYAPGCVMYDSMRSNLPKEIMSFDADNIFRDFAPDTVIHDSTSSFVGHRDVMNYLQLFCDKYNLHDCIRFGQEVLQIRHPSQISCTNLNSLSQSSTPNDKWEIINKSIESVVTNHEYVGAIMICNGHFSQPYFPLYSIPGFLSHIPAKKILHSMNYDSFIREGIFHNKRILIIGAKSSGTDMARELCMGVSRSACQYSSHSRDNTVSSVTQQKAAMVYASDRNYCDSTTSTTLFIDQPSTLQLYPGIISVNMGGMIEFQDHRTLSIHADIDYLLVCTGYEYHFPFFEDDESPVGSNICLPIDVSNTEMPLWQTEKDKEVINPRLKYKKVRHLFQQLLWIDDFSKEEISSLAFVGLPFNIVPFPLFTIQALYIAKLWSVKFGLISIPVDLESPVVIPSHEEQFRWWKEFEYDLLTSGRFTDKYHFLGGDLQWRYIVNDLLPFIEAVENASSTLISSTEDIHHQRFQQQRRRDFVRVLQEIYTDNVYKRPTYTGAPDTYRQRRFRIVEIIRRNDSDGDEVLAPSSTHESCFTWTVEDISI